MANWDKRFMELAIHIGQWSKDAHKQVGCVIIGPDNEIRSAGYNGFPRGVNDEIASRYERPEKYFWTEHAERNAVYNASRTGAGLKDCRIYVTRFPCMDCARAIIQSGIRVLTAPKPDLEHPRWGGHFQLSLEMFAEVGVEVRWYEDGPIEGGRHPAEAA